MIKYQIIHAKGWLGFLEESQVSLVFFFFLVRSRFKVWRSMLQMQLSETCDSTVTVLVFEVLWPAND